MQNAKLIIDLLNDQSRLLQSIVKKVNKLDIHSNLDKEYLTTKEACSYLGCSRSMLHKLVVGGKLNRHKLANGRTYYASNELKQLIESPDSFDTAA